MSLRKKYYVLTYGGLISFVIMGISLCWLTDLFPPYPIIFILWVAFISWLRSLLKCPNCHTKINDFCTPLSGHYDAEFTLHLKSTRKCPGCGCDWE